MNFSKTLFYLPAFGLLAFITPQPDKNAAGEAKIVLDKQENMLQIKSYYLNEGAEMQQLSYKLFTIKKGKTGRSRNAQGGSFKIEAGGKELLAQTRINVNPGDFYAIKLVVYQNGELVSQDSVQFDGTKPDVTEP